jgi:hypothetical protein
MQPLILLSSVAGVFLSNDASPDCTIETFSRAIANSRGSIVVNAKQFADNASFNPFPPGGPPGMPNRPGMPKGPKMGGSIRLPALCQVEIRVTSSPNSTYSYGLFLPQKWNRRFL